MVIKILTLACGEQVFLDDEDYEKIPKTGWYLHSTRTEGQNRKTSYVYHDTYGALHRFILGIEDKRLIVDHIDRNGLNNQRKNLRVTNTSLNKRNQDTCRNNKFNFNGICFEKGKNGRSSRIICRWSENEDSPKSEKRKIQKKKSFTLSKYNSFSDALREAILFRISKMKEFNYLLDERSTTIEKILLENKEVNLEELLNIKFSNFI